jgi:hypothetical protein
MNKRSGDGFLPMWGVPEQVPLRGSICASHTVTGREGIADAAATLAKLDFQSASSHVPDRGHLQAADALAAEPLTRAAVNHVAALPQAGEVPPEEAALRERLRLIKDLQANSPTSACRDVRRVVEQVVTDCMDVLRQRLTASFDADPAAHAEAVRQVRTVLAETRWPTPNGQPLQRLTNACTKLHELPRFEDRLTPEVYRRVCAYLGQEGRAAAEGALEEVVRSVAAEAYQRQLPGLTRFLREAEQQGQRYAEQVKAFLDALAENQRAVRAQRQGRSSSVSVLLPGVGADEVLSGMKAARDCPDTHALATQLHADFAARLRETARRSHPQVDADRASVPTLLLHLGATELADAWLRLVEENLGGGHSLYDQARAYGLTRLAEELWQTAAPTCFFLGRDHDRFGMNLTEVAVVRLPLARGPADEQARGELAEFFRRRSLNCDVTDGSRADAEISVCRINAGWVIGAELANGALIQRYGQASDQGHPPHLLGLVSDAELGKASTAYLHLLSYSPAQRNGRGEDSLGR